jgi:hypothetical protein
LKKGDEFYHAAPPWTEERTPLAANKKATPKAGLFVSLRAAESAD